MSTQFLVAPFPWFGGKTRISSEVWRRFGDVPNYVEPFAGSLAVLLGRPRVAGRRTETINDIDGFIANFWRAVSHDPEAVASHADYPVSEADLHARHSWLVTNRKAITDSLHADPDWYDARTAGWWVWGVCSWIGSGWCSGDGPWHVVDGVLTDVRQLPHLGNAGQGINAWMLSLAERLRGSRVACGDWSRVVSDSVTIRHGVTGVLLDPPYGDDHGDYYATDSRTAAGEVQAWCLENGARTDLRIALCGYSRVGTDPLADAGWSVHRWSSKGGYGSQGNGQGRINARRETVWFSPGCLSSDSLLDLLDAS